MNKKTISTMLLAAALSLEASAYQVTHVDEAPQWQVDWSYNQERPDWQEPQASDYVNFSVMLVTIEEALQPYVSEDDLLALFIGDELRGLATPALDMTAGTTDPTRFVLKAYGNESDGERIDATLKYYNAQLRQVFTRSATMMYDVEVVLGIDEPFSPAFTLGSAKYPVVNTIDVADMIAYAGITPADGDMAAAFVGDDCRGVAKFAAEADDNTQSAEFILHCSLANAGENVVFKYYDADHSCIITFDGTVTADANGDGTVDVADIATVISVMTGSASVSLATAADVNGDGTVDVADIATIISVMAKGQAQPATRPLTITVSETPFISPDASSAGARVGDYKSPLTSSVKRAAITTTSTLTAFNMNYTYMFGSTLTSGERTATKDGEGKWTITGYWPDPDATVSWYAHTDGTFYQTDDANKAPYLSFTVNDEVANQKDLLVATAAGTWDNTNGNLSFTFDHACSALCFYMKKATNMSDYTLTVTSVILHNVVKKGEYYYDTSKWTPDDATTDYTLFTGKATLGTADYTPMDTGVKPYVIVIPQTLTAWDPTTALSNSYLELECTISKSGTSSFSGKAYIPFAADFEQGYQHNVKVNIGKNSLYNKSGNKIIQP